MVAIPEDENLLTTILSTKLFIDNSPGAFSSVGFATGPDRLTNGFLLYGPSLMWTDPDDETAGLQAKWYAVPTGRSGLYILKWNVDILLQDGALPVNLKVSIPP